MVISQGQRGIIFDGILKTSSRLPPRVGGTQPGAPTLTFLEYTRSSTYVIARVRNAENERAKKWRKNVSAWEQ